MPLDRYKRPVAVADENDAVLDVASQMRDASVGAVVVVRGKRPVGIVTDRDLAIRVLGERRDPTECRVRDVVTWDPIVVAVTDGIETAAARMRKHGIRRLPIVNEAGELVGIVTADDLLTLLGGEISDLCAGIESSADSTESR